MRKKPDNRTSIVVIYQDVKSGANVATEELVTQYRRSYPVDTLHIYKQKAHFFTGPFSYLINLIFSMGTMYTFLQSVERVDCVVSSLFTFTVPWLLSRHRNVKAIFYIHGDQRFRRETHFPSPHTLYRSFVGSIVTGLQDFAIRKSTLLAFVSDTGRRAFVTEKGAWVMRKSFILPNGIDPTKFVPAPVHARHALLTRFRAAGTFQIAFVGRADEKKGVHHLIRALSHIGSPVSLWIIYPSPHDHYSIAYLALLHKLASSLPKRHTIRFVKDTRELPELYRIMDFLVLPSRQEMLPLVLLEALSSGVIPIATDVGESGKILRRISPDLILPSQDPHAIAETITAWMNRTQKQRDDIKKRGMEAAASYTWQKTAGVLFARIHATESA